MSIRPSLLGLGLALGLVAGVASLLAPDADARGGARGGGGARAGGGGARTSINHAGGGGARSASGGASRAGAGAGANRASAGANRGGRDQGTRNTANQANRTDISNRQRNTERNTNIERNTNVNIEGDGGCCNDNWYGDHPLAATAAVTATAALTAAAIGSIVYSVPPSCVTTVINGMTYQQCGSTWYQPQYAGTSVQYVVVNPPQ